MTQTATPSHEGKKHIFFFYAKRDESDSSVAKTLMKQLIERRLRIYHPREDEDINTRIATGIENAAVVLIFPSPSLQMSKSGSKILNYADQIKIPILNIKHCEDFQPTGWLGAVLAAAKSCSTDYNEVMKSLIYMKINISKLVLERGEKNEPQESTNHLFKGGTKSGNVTASYSLSGQEFPIEFEFLGLENGSIFGQGDDEVGAFTIAGKYKVEDGHGNVNMHKQYVGQHSITYQGKISFEGTECMIEGIWEKDNVRDNFFIHITLPEVYTTDGKKMPLSTGSSHPQGHKVMLSYCPCQHDLAQQITKGLIAKGVPAICPPVHMHDMIKAAAKEARVVVPLMSEAYEASSTAKHVLTYVDQAGIPIVPVKAQDPYSQDGWLGVICAGALWTQMTNPDDFDKKLDDLIGQLHPYISDSANEEQHIDVLVDGSHVHGYYMNEGEKCDMKFDMFTMTNGSIAGQGDDDGGGFVIHGKYTPLPDKEDFEFQFKKHYIGKHDVQYSGITTHTESHFMLDGKWISKNLSDSFHLKASRQQSSGPKGMHIMLSYQWNSQELVKRVADMLKEKNIPIWFDIAGDMKGNINAAMANGVEDAAMIISFNTTAYSDSVNCQKELTYASQLKKNILPVLLEDDENFKSTWLEMIIASLNKVNMQDSEQFNAIFNTLMERVDAILEETKKKEFHHPHVLTKFEGGAVRGKYYQSDQGFDMSFDFFSLRKGKVSGQGNDQVGHFTMAGNYDSEGNVSFSKQYIGQHAIEYNGDLTCDDFGRFKIQGNWSVDGETGQFSLESI